jgi:predicted DNA-binding transcriptional regulator AlpA
VAENSKDKELQRRFLGTKDIQQMFGISRTKAVALMKSDGFPLMKLGKSYRVDSVKLEEWISRQETETKNKIKKKGSEDVE